MLAESTWLTALYLVVCGLFPAGCTAQTSLALVSPAYPLPVDKRVGFYSQDMLRACLPAAAAVWVRAGTQQTHQLDYVRQIALIMLLLPRPSFHPLVDAATPEAAMSNPLMNQLLNCRIFQPGLLN